MFAELGTAAGVGVRRRSLHRRPSVHHRLRGHASRRGERDLLVRRLVLRRHGELLIDGEVDGRICDNLAVLVFYGRRDVYLDAVGDSQFDVAGRLLGFVFRLVQGGHATARSPRQRDVPAAVEVEVLLIAFAVIERDLVGAPVVLIRAISQTFSSTDVTVDLRWLVARARVRLALDRLEDYSGMSVAVFAGSGHLDGSGQRHGLRGVGVTLDRRRVAADGDHADMILFNLTVFDLEEFNDGHGLGRLNNGVNQLDCRSINIRRFVLLDFANVGSSRKCRFRHGNLTPGGIDNLRAEHFESLALNIPVNLEARNPRNGHVSAARSSSARFCSGGYGDL